MELIDKTCRDNAGWQRCDGDANEGRNHGDERANGGDRIDVTITHRPQGDGGPFICIH